MANVSKAYHFFHAICISVSLLLIGRAIYHYAIDQDTTNVNFRKFNEFEGSSYPSISFCLRDPLVLHYWKTNNGGLKNNNPWERMANYRKFLQGEFYSDELAQVDYDKASRSLVKYLKKVLFYFKNNHSVYWKPKNGSFEIIVPHLDRGKLTYCRNADCIKNALAMNKTYPLLPEQFFKIPPPKVYISKRSANEKCYSFDITSLSNEILERMDISIDPDIFKTKHGHNIDKNIGKRFN